MMNSHQTTDRDVACPTGSADAPPAPLVVHVHPPHEGAAPTPKRSFRRWGMTLGILAALIAAGAAGYRFLSARLTADFLVPAIAESLEKQLGSGRTVSVGSSELRTETPQTQLIARQIDIRSAEGALLATIPQARFEFESLSLGVRPKIARIDIEEAALLLRIDPDGAVTLEGVAPAPKLAEPDAVRPAATETAPPLSPDRPTPDFAIPPSWISALESLTKPDASVAAIGLRGGRIRINDQRRGATWQVSNVAADLARTPEGGVVLRASGGEAERPWAVTASLGGERNGNRTLEAVTQTLPMQDLLAALGLSAILHADVPLSGGLRAIVNQQGVFEDVGLQAVIGGGTAGYANAAEKTRIDDGALAASWRRGEPMVRIDRLQWSSPRVSAVLAGRVSSPRDWNRPLRIELASGQVVIPPTQQGEQAVTLDQIAGTMTYDQTARTVNVERIDIRSGMRGRLVGEGSMDFSGSTPGMKLGIAGSYIPLKAAILLWPEFAAPTVRAWLRDNTSDGMVETISLATNIPTHREAEPSRPLAVNDLSVEARITDATLMPAPGLPPIRGADAIVKVDGMSTRIQIGKARLDLGQGRTLALADAMFTVPDHRLPSPPARLRLGLSGPAESAIVLLNNDQIAEPGATKFDPKLYKGNVSAVFDASLPLSAGLSRKGLDYTLDAELTQFSQDKAFGESKLDAATVKLKASNKDIALKGDGKLAGTAATFEYRRALPAGKPELKLQASLDAAARARFGADLGARIVGATPVKISSVAGPTGRYQVEADLTAATLADLVPGWAKPGGQAAKARFLVVQNANDNWKIDDLTIEGRGVLVRGALEVDEDGTIVTGTFPAYHLADGDKASLRIERQGKTARVQLRGDVLDARGLIRHMADGGPKPAARSGQANTAPTDLEIDAKLGAVVGSNGEVMRSYEAQFTRRGGEWRTLSATGRIGRDAPFRASIRQDEGGPRLFVLSDDAGAFLRFVNVYPAMQGGRLGFLGPINSDGGIRGGLLEVVDFAIRGDQAIAQMVAQADPLEPGGGAPRRPSSASGEAANFTRLKVDFTRTGGKLVVNEGLLWGATIGATVEGELEYARDRVSLRGTYLPAYAVNNLLARIPVVGIFLGGGADEGVVGISYAISGPASAPRLTVNPFSVVTPGILRKMLEFRQQGAAKPLIIEAR